MRPPKRVVVFYDAQNLYHGARDAWAPIPPIPGSPYSYPAFDVLKLARYLAERIPGRALKEVRFYTGVPTLASNPFWHGFWSNKLRYLGSQGVYVFRGRINASGQEKGVDVSIAIDLVKLTYERAYEVAVLVSSDADLGPAVGLCKSLSKDQRVWRDFESAYAFHPPRHAPRGMPGTTWIRLDKSAYDSCLDPTDYRP